MVLYCQQHEQECVKDAQKCLTENLQGSIDLVTTGVLAILRAVAAELETRIQTCWLLHHQVSRGTSLAERKNWGRVSCMMVGSMLRCMKTHLCQWKMHRAAPPGKLPALQTAVRLRREAGCAKREGKWLCGTRALLREYTVTVEHR